MVIVSLAPTKKPTDPVDILSNRYLKNTLRIDYNNVCHVSVDIMDLILKYFSVLS